jgi:hypothetical protein
MSSSSTPRVSRTLRGKQATAKPPYLLWELEAEKPL